MAETKPKPKSADPKSADFDPCTAAGVPGAEHEVLRAFEGKWKAAVSFWMQPGAEPMAAEGSMTNEWILDGRFLQQRYTSDFLGSPFAGHGLFGFNRVDGRYEGLWVDTMSTAMMTEHGAYEPSIKTFTMEGTVTDPANGKTMRKKTVITIDSKDQHTMSMHFAEDGQKFWKCMEIVYTRP